MRLLRKKIIAKISKMSFFQNCPFNKRINKTKKFLFKIQYLLDWLTRHWRNKVKKWRIDRDLWNKLKESSGRLFQATKESSGQEISKIRNFENMNLILFYNHTDILNKLFSYLNLIDPSKYGLDRLSSKRELRSRNSKIKYTSLQLNLYNLRYI